MKRFGKVRLRVRRMQAKVKPARVKISSMRRGARRKMTKMGVGQMRSLLILPLLLVLIVLTAWLRTTHMYTVRFRPTEQALANPLTGYAVSARDDIDSAPQETQLAWAVASWRELEPEEGEYAFDEFDEAIHIEQWRARGVKLVFRLALDLGGNSDECDIPDWLRAQTKGAKYEFNSETRYVPDYSDPVLQDRHFALLQAIGERYGDDIAYVEMGSLGRDGTWMGDEHASVREMPMLDVTSVYIWQYFNAFSQNCVLVAAPYREAMLGGGGAYLTDLADENAAWEQLDRFRFGGWDEITGAKLLAQTDLGLNAPVGGWIKGREQEFFAQDGTKLRRIASESRASYICLNCGGLPQDVRSQENMQLLLREMGYRLWIRQAQWQEKVRPDYSLYVDIAIANDGCAPMQQSWPVCLALIDGAGNVVHSEQTDADVQDWLPGDSSERVRITIPADMEKGEYTLAFAVCDPDTLQPVVRLAMEGGESGLWYELGPVRVY